MSIRNFFIGLIMLILGVRYGAAYLLSDKFQEYANRTKEPWTCQFENYIGHFYMLMSEYETAELYFQHTMKRCPDSEISETAEFETARCFEGVGQSQQAVQKYMEFAEKHKGTRRARLASQAADLLRVN